MKMYWSVSQLLIFKLLEKADISSLLIIIMNFSNSFYKCLGTKREYESKVDIKTVNSKHVLGVIEYREFTESEQHSINWTGMNHYQLR